MNPESQSQRLYKHVDCLAGLIGSRHLQKPASITATIGYIKQQWTAMEYDITEQAYPTDTGTATNLIIELPGTSRRDEIVLVGAHYDTVPGTPGADDNASAVAVMLEVSRILAGTQGKRTVRFVAFACEEPPHFHTGEMGSQIHARQAKLQGEKIVGMLCLEMVGYFNDQPFSQRAPQSIPSKWHWLFPNRGDFLASVGNLKSWRLSRQFRRGFRQGTQLPLFSIVLPEKIREIRLSDNSSFWDQGYPALMLTDTSFLRNPNYHLASDTPETLDYNSMSRVCDGVASAVAFLRK